MAAAETMYDDWLEELRALKLEHARRKRELRGPTDADEQGIILLPDGAGELVEAVSGSGVVVRDMVLKGYEPIPNHPSGGFFGPKAVGENFRRLLAVHPTYIHPANTMAGVYMVNFLSYRSTHWNPDFSTEHLEEDWERYGIDPGVGGVQHFCPDLRIGLDLGWGGLLRNVHHYRSINKDSREFYDGLEETLLGIQEWIGRHAADARAMAETEPIPSRKLNLETIAEISEHLVDGAPRTFREACQWLVYFQAAAKMFNGSGEWGRLDELLRPYYERDTRAGRLTDEEAIFHLACLLLSETAYIQLGGPDADGRDLTSPVSFLILEAVHRLKAPANIGVRVGEGLSEDLFRRGLEILFEDKTGCPKFIGDRAVTEGFTRNGYPIELARTRTYSGCHWLAIPGREYTMCDMIKVDLAKVFDLSLREMMEDASATPSTAELWERFESHVRRAVDVVIEGVDLHLEHMHEVFPELVLDLVCHGPVESGLDVSCGGVEFTDIGIDASSLATVADSFGSIERRVETEGLLTWEDLWTHLQSDWAGPEGEGARLLMKSASHYGSGDSAADRWADRTAAMWTGLLANRETPGGARLIPGLFTWAMVIPYGQRLGATPNGRHAGEPVSHGPNPDPGCNGGKPGTPTQMAAAVARVQPGYGNTAPLQLDLDPGVASGVGGIEKVAALLQTHFDMGGTLVNVNIVDRETILDAARDPSKHPDLVVRITGFSAYFASLSDDLRQFVVNRIVSEA